ncbi:hypothetical protein VTJ04DRAFT_6186 [Mycothermus thermophilus]|uniref:uncharacterized protein n=1 Tax=Humicola insolens TaxID=85995 RepID=UPI0037435A40
MSSSSAFWWRPCFPVRDGPSGSRLHISMAPSRPHVQAQAPRGIDCPANGTTWKAAAAQQGMAGLKTISSQT